MFSKTSAISLLNFDEDFGDLLQYHDVFHIICYASHFIFRWITKSNSVKIIVN